MNVVFTQIRDTFGLPKGVMHFIVHLVRPRAPPRPEYEKWRTHPIRNAPEVLLWYNYVVRTDNKGFYCLAIYLDGETWEYALCPYCLKHLVGVDPLLCCKECHSE